ncbi:tetratricopeptide repeat protein [Streptomyces sp. TLI_171]|uniref:tetratricopeptide repeat protein n=1 Tax=Streptomyces sp. TLI_171 TaxID=1938859 RepID=UPI000C199E6F|nr:tetratricopeptide repeat protein [Streptomyces sp. TLI_171]RKE05106.1 tetratricopeptide (TPR) repeat protein [Streptomyces sp. TLI_171]
MDLSEQDLARLTLVEVSLSRGYVRYGSGWLLGPRLVLTARHVVTDSDGTPLLGIGVQVGDPRTGAPSPPPVRRGARVCWPMPGSVPVGAPDVALLLLDEPVPVGAAPPVRWGQITGITELPYQGFGFPRFADLRDLRGRSPVSNPVEHLRGRLSPVSSDGLGALVLDTSTWPPESPDPQQQWSGASGAAVFCHGRLVGVVGEAYGGHRQYAYPASLLLVDTGFLRLVTEHSGGQPFLETVRAVRGDPLAPEVIWPVELGRTPALVTAFQPRATLRKQINEARSRTATVVLTQVLSGGGGVGKSQLAASYAALAIAEGTDLMMWVDATGLQQVVTQYAQAAERLKLPGVQGDDPEHDARVFLEWLSATSSRWLLVLDDITDPDALRPWWPVSRTGAGWVLATTRRRDAEINENGRTVVPVDVYEPQESAAYLDDRLAAADRAYLLGGRAPALAAALGHLPLALSHATAYMINEELGCTAYLEVLTARQALLDQVLPPLTDDEGNLRRITATLLLSLDAVQALDPLAAPVLRMIALLDPVGHPRSLWDTAPVADGLVDRRRRVFRRRPPAPTPAQANSALNVLHRYALITRDGRDEARAVRIHALTARAVRESTPVADLPRLATAAADALLALWPDTDQPHPELAGALRTNADTLARHAGDHLWTPLAHPVLQRAGNSLLENNLPGLALAHWQGMAENSARRVGPGHRHTLTYRSNVSTAHRQAGRLDEAVALQQQVVADSERFFGGTHSDTVAALANLALSLWQAGRVDEAITLMERVLVHRVRTLGPAHRDTVVARSHLASAYHQAGRGAEAAALEQGIPAALERVFGAEHPETLAALGNTAAHLQQQGRTREALELQEEVLLKSERILGPTHPATLRHRTNLASYHWAAGRVAEAVALQQEALADSERVLGSSHPNTITMRGNLALYHHRSGRLDEAVALAERALADNERVRPDHPTTRGARVGLANFYWEAGRAPEAVALIERAIAEYERIYGPTHPSVLACRKTLDTWRGSGG